MPKLDLTIPADALSDGAQQELARELGRHPAPLGGRARHRVLPLDHLGPRARAARRSRSRPPTASPSRTPSSTSPSRAARSATGARPGWSRTSPSWSSRRPAGGRRRRPGLGPDPRGAGRELGRRGPGRPLRAAPRRRQGRARAGGLGQGEGPGRRGGGARSRREAARSSSRRASSSGARRPTRSSRATARRSCARSPSRPATSTPPSSRAGSRSRVPSRSGTSASREVTEVGDSVTSVKPGDLVSVPVPDLLRRVRRLPRRADRQLRVGAAALDVRPADRPQTYGGFASDAVNVPYADAMLVPIPDGVEPHGRGQPLRQHPGRLAVRGASARRGARARRC